MKTDPRKHASGPSKVLSNRPVGPGWWVLRLSHPEIARDCRPGQFVQIRCGSSESFDPLLRRPFSVYSVERGAGTYDILYTVVGRGTRWISQLLPETPADVAGPFGNSFTPPGPQDRVLLVGGGVGVAPLYFLAREILASREARSSGVAPPPMTLCVGARTRELLQGIADFRGLPLEIKTSTDDGSEGFRGFVTDLLEGILDGERDVSRIRVYGCGPQAMNESLTALLVKRGIWGEICLEALMACGFGICFGCIAPIRKEIGGEIQNRRVCWDGPVFDARLLHP